MKAKRALWILAVCAITVSGVRAQQWPHYAGDQAASHYSPLDQITPANVGKLAIAWEWKPNEKVLPQFGTRPGAFQNTPLMIDNVLYVSTPYNQVAALDATSGKELWRYDPKAYEDGQPPNGQGFAHRGVVAWRDPSTSLGAGRGELRIFLNARYKLIQLDAKTGLPVDGFGTNGVVDLSEGLVWAINKKHYTNTSPPIVYKDLIIVGNGVGDRLTYKNDPPGDVRAFHARTGKLVWKFNTIPQRGEFGNNTWDGGSWQFTGHTNVWAPMSVDEQRGLLFMPVSTPSNDYYGGRRPGQNLFAESIVCLDANTGQRKWHYPDRPSRPVGLRPGVGAQSRHHHRRRQAHRRGRAAHQAGLGLRLRPRDRPAGVADRREAGRPQRCARRSLVADAAGAGETAGL